MGILSGGLGYGRIRRAWVSKDGDNICREIEEPGEADWYFLTRKHGDGRRKEHGSSAGEKCQKDGERERWENRCVRGCNCRSREMVYYSVHLAVLLNYAHCPRLPSPTFSVLSPPSSTPLPWQRKMQPRGYEEPSKVGCSFNGPQDVPKTCADHVRIENIIQSSRDRQS